MKTIWLWFAILLVTIIFSCSTKPTKKIDRFALVNRHNIEVTSPDTLASLSVGNGNFAFTTDITGLQTFYKHYEKGVSLGTMSKWGWHTIPNLNGFSITESYLYHDVEGRRVPYQHQLRSTTRENEASNYFRENPHRLHLGLIRLVVIKENGQEINPEDIESPIHSLNLWQGKITSQFHVEGKPVRVEVFAHPEKDMISAAIESPLIKTGQLAVEWLFPYAMPVHTHAGYDFQSPDKHQSVMKPLTDHQVVISRQLDNDHYFTTINWKTEASINQKEPHRFVLMPQGKAETLEFSCLFSPHEEADELPDFASTAAQNKTHWKNFWKTGGAVDFSECTDPRAPELERRTVLSQYLTKINGSGNLPPQETGLTFNSWFGKFHLEMIWWHSAHYYNWQRTGYTANQLDYYQAIYPQSAAFTREQGYKGVRWPKMVGPDGINSPSSVGSYLIWQQPHLIYLAEQLYQSNPSKATLEKYGNLVFATADFMADFARPDEKTGVYNLEPPLIPAQEHWDKDSTWNPPFELAYWHWGLTVASEWKKRLGQEPDSLWTKVLDHLPAPVSIDGLYMGIGNAPDSYSNPLNMRDHPMVLGTLGMLPLWDQIDPEKMRNTLKLIMDQWNWQHTWGWDYPMVAMCATRLYEPEITLDALLMEVQKNTCLVNGHNYQDERLRIYLPGNGGLLKAVALMCAGWEGCEVKNPGFPKDGTWNVKWENLNPDF